MSLLQKTNNSLLTSSNKKAAPKGGLFIFTVCFVLAQPKRPAAWASIV